MNSLYDQSEIEQILINVVKKAKITENIFPGDRPQSIPVRMQDFVVVKVTGNILDNNAYGSTICSIDLYTKDLSGGIKNTKKLSSMYQRLVDGFTASSSNLLFNNVRVIADVPDGYGFHIRMINIQTIIKII